MTPTPQDPVDALMALAKECGATMYAHRTSPHEPAVAFSPSAWEAFSARALAAVPAEPLDGEMNWREGAEPSHPQFVKGFQAGHIRGRARGKAQQAGGVPAGRTPQDYAIEHAEYMGQAAEQMIDAVNDLARAESEHEDGIANESDVHAAIETVTEATTSLRSSIYEFRKRRDRAAPSPSAVQPLSEAQIVKCLVESSCIGKVAMSFESGPYDITRPSINADRLVRAVEAAHGIKDGK